MCIKKSGINARVFAFLGQMSDAYSAADLVISRAGALSIAEIAFFKLPALLIPYPYAYQHQQVNARVLEKKGVAEVLEEASLSVKELRDKLKDFMDNPSRLAIMRDNYGESIDSSAAKRLVEII